MKIAWKGPSQIDGSPVMVAITESRGNSKTGKSLQAWIMPCASHPVEAIHSGSDVAVCGDCPQRPSVGGACYVSPRPLISIHAAARLGPGAEPVESIVDGCAPRFRKLFRFGAWGDPAAVPLEFWKRVLRLLKSRKIPHVGYTHQWRRLPLAWSEFLMASCETEQDARDAEAAGWRPFLVIARDAPAPRGLALCPASEEAGKKRTCATCLACGGTSKSRGAGIYIRAHGFRVANARRKRGAKKSPFVVIE